MPLLTNKYLRTESNKHNIWVGKIMAWEQVQVDILLNYDMDLYNQINNCPYQLPKIKDMKTNKNILAFHVGQVHLQPMTIVIVISHIGTSYN